MAEIAIVLEIQEDYANDSISLNGVDKGFVAERRRVASDEV
jgi:hypothetical protein